ncbi:MULTISPECIES: OmpL47-type beta-barrel domain-containing protein [unclassified Streptomyces]|uniref:OmpL47-type beta-barrel domain-containing protein n=1 Tax=unclassified Streptomyces TaxID=2593676 RepID=UPI000747ABC8|nr:MULTISPECIES: family 16 glycoside hydrolase [unclassified Streptomyces]KUL78236.1 glycosyl hydrolase [Streptomyces sp. NRRL WC-3605]KUL79414.1 glycosyl hydrolase [Streptomyces sp. NRRL WC-3604]
MTRRAWAALLAALLVVLGLQALPATGQPRTEAEAAAAQVLTWTAGDDITKYASAPTTAVAGPATIVFENSAATGNSTGMPHTLTFDTSDVEFNDDVQLNILANPNDDQGGRHTAEVTLTPGRYRYHCTIPGHGQMQGILIVTEGTGEDTTAPEASAHVSGTQNAQGQYVGSASVAVHATDEEGGSGVDRVEYALGDGAWQPYTAPVVVDQVGDHTVRYRALDKAGNVSAEKRVTFTVVAPQSDDTTPPETSATVSGEKDADGAYIGMATVTVSASDTGSGVNGVEYALGDGAWQPYTAPVMVHEPGSHTVRYRATDKAGNVAPAKDVRFTVVPAPEDDTTAPVTGVTVEGTKNSSGAYVGSAEVTVTAADEHHGSGVDRIEYSIDGGPYLAYSAPVVVDRAGTHTLAYRATDKAGNTSAARTVTFTVVSSQVPAPNCPEFDERLTVIVGTVDSGVPNRLTDSRCRINELIEDEKEWTSHALFVKHVTSVLDKLLKEGVVDQREYKAIRKAARQSGIGEPGQTEGYRTILDGSPESFAKWQQVGGGSFAPNGDGSITSGTSRSGLGMLWFPERKYGDFSLKLQWRDDAPGTGNANSGVFVRFPWVHDHPEEPRPEWAAIKFGHEIQVFDSPTGDMYKTGSVYGFDRVGLAGAGVTQKGTWNDYEIRVVDQHYSVYRNGVLINEFDNTGGQVFEPPRSDDPGTDGRRFASGYIGLQVHSTTDVVSYRDVRIKEL